MDTTAAVSAGAFGAALAALADDAGVDAVIALPVPTAVADLIPELCAARLPVPLAVVMLGQPESVQVLRGRGEVADAPGGQEPPDKQPRTGRPSRRTPTRKAQPGASGPGGALGLWRSPARGHGPGAQASGPPRPGP